MRYTTKRNGKSVIPLLMAVCGLNLPYWRIDRADDLHSYLSGDAADKLAAYEDAEEQGRLVRTPYKVGDLFWAVAYSDPRVIHVRLYQVTYHYKDGWVLWVENIDNDNDWWKVPLEAFETWSCFDTYEEAEAALVKGIET